jgi:hypothetical protein
MRLPYTLDTFTPHAWEKVFGVFVLVNRSHWRGAPYDAVVNILRAKGRFEFSVTGMGTWTSKFVLVVLPDGYLDAAFIPNEETSAMMQKHLERMKEQFESELEKL